MPPINLLIKPASGNCNLRCRYCFYKDEMMNRETPIYSKMTEYMLEVLVKKALEYAEDSVTFGFQGGEPTLMGLDFYRTFCRLTEKYNRKHLKIYRAIQTNGILLNEEWAKFFAEEKFLVGLSLDGPRPVHDKYRISADGEGTFKTVMHSARILSEAGADFNILTVLTEDSAGDIERIYKFFISNNFLYQQYIPCIEPLNDKNKEYSLNTETYGKCLKKLFDLWYEDVIRGVPVYNRYFENLIDIIAGYEPESCDMRGYCSVQYVIEANGDVYPCDFYAMDDYRIGNIADDEFEEIDNNRFLKQFIQTSVNIHDKCKQCQWINLCRGGCRRNRETINNELGLNRFCDATEAFLSYAIDRLVYLANITARLR